MELWREKIEELLHQESIINEYGVGLHFIGDLQPLAEPVRAAMERAMKVTAHNNQRVLLICVAYTCRQEIIHAVQECCKEKWNEVQASSREAKLTNDFELLLQNSCKDYLNATKASSSVPKGVKGARDKDGMLEHNVEKQNSETEITSCNQLVEMTGERKYKKGEVPFIKPLEIEKHMNMAIFFFGRLVPVLYFGLK